MTLDRVQLGARGEQLAVAHLEGLGMVVLARNWRCAQGGLRGEIDIIARDGAVVVFCEVKARRGTLAGSPLEAITPRKVAQLRRLAGAWLAAAARPFTEVRLDAVGVAWPGEGGKPDLVHVTDIG